MRTIGSEKVLERIEKRDTPSHLFSEISLLSLDKVALVSLPGEVYAQIGQKIKGESPFSNTLVCGYANEVVGYIASNDDFDENWLRNNFPVWYWGVYFFSSSMEKVILEETKKLGKKLKNGGQKYIPSSFVYRKVLRQYQEYF